MPKSDERARASELLRRHVGAIEDLSKALDTLNAAADKRDWSRFLGVGLNYVLVVATALFLFLELKAINESNAIAQEVSINSRRTQYTTLLWDDGCPLKADYPRYSSGCIATHNERIRSEAALGLVALERLRQEVDESYRPDLADSHLENTDLSGSNLEGVLLHRAVLVRTNLRGAHLREADISVCSMWSADLREADLRGAKLDHSNLQQAKLDRSNLRGASLQDASLWEANLKAANLDGANLEGADLFGANLEGANLRGANLEGALMVDDAFDHSDDRFGRSAANLQGAINLDCDQLKTAKSWESTYRDEALACGQPIPKKPADYLWNNTTK